MFILFDFALSLILASLFIVSYIVIEKIRSSKIFFRWQVYEYIKNAIEGIVYGLLIIVFKVILNGIEPNFIVPIFIVGVLALSMVRTVVVGIFSMIAPLIYYVIVNSTNDLFYLILGLMFLMLFVIEIIHYFINEFVINLMINIIWTSFALFSVLIYDFIINKQLSQLAIEVVLMPFISLMIVYIGLEIAIKFLISANILYKSDNFNFSRYYRQSLREVVIGEFINEYKLTRGIYGILEFNYPLQKVIEKDLEIKESILLDLERTFPIKAILFRSDESRYGFFLPLNQSTCLKEALKGNNQVTRSVKDLLKNLETILLSRSITYSTSWKQKVGVKIRCGVAIYGIQDASITNLHSLADFALKNEQSSQKNIVQLFNPHDYFNNINEEKAINAMDWRIKLDNFVNYFTPIFNVKSKKTIFNIVTPEKIEYSEIKESVRDFINFFEWTNIFDRYMAFWALSNSKQLKDSEQKIAFFYSPQILELNFEFNSFKQKLYKLNITLEKIILIFDFYMFEKIKNYELFFNNLNDLKNYGVEIALINAHQFTSDNFSQLCPNYVLIDNNQAFLKFQKMSNNLNKVQIVWFNLQNQQDFNFAMTNGAHLIGGSMLQKRQFMSNFDKKSKIYIYDLLKSRSK